MTDTKDPTVCQVTPKGTKIWTHNGVVHRHDGPACEYADGHVGWWLHGNYYTLDQFLERTTCSPEDKFMLKLRYG